MFYSSRILTYVLRVKTPKIKNLSINVIKISPEYCFSCTFGLNKPYCSSKVTTNLLRHQGVLKTMKIGDSPHFKACITEEVQTLRKFYVENGYEIRIVGGAVRDLLLGIKPEDLDFATTATPEEMKKIFIANNIRLLNTNGEKHGTITVRINDKNYEITTLRIDMVADGRHAEVQFTQNWLFDANRRDLTVNAMYLDFNGTLYDYFNGYADLQNHRVRFVGNASLRIQEDYLRILRYFRFYGKISKEPDNHFQDIIDAIRENASGLKNISGERIWTELSKIVLGNFAYECLVKIIKLDIGPYIGFPEKCNEAELKNVYDRLKRNKVSVKPITILTAIFNTQEELNNFFARIKPSSFDRELGCFILNNRHNACEKPYRICQKHIILSNNILNSTLFAHELLKYRGNIDALKNLENWKVPKFPVNGNHLKEMGIKGKKIGMVLCGLKNIWADHDFNIEIEKLLEHVPNIMADKNCQNYK